MFTRVAGVYSLSLGLYSMSWSASMESRAARSDSMTDRRRDCWDQRRLLFSLDPMGVALRMEALLATAAFHSFRFFSLELLLVAITLASLPNTSMGLSVVELDAMTELIKSSTMPIWNPFLSRRSRSLPFFPPTVVRSSHQDLIQRIDPLKDFALPFAFRFPD